jgi:hypothetical protein
MAGFTTKTFAIHDDYETPKSAWEAIKHIIPKDKIIWEAFYCRGESGNILREIGFNVIHEPVDFYTHDLGEIIVSNPPFSDAKAVMSRLKQLDKPFIMIMPSSKINTSYFREWKIWVCRLSFHANGSSLSKSSMEKLSIRRTPAISTASTTATKSDSSATLSGWINER